MRTKRWIMMFAAVATGGCTIVVSAAPLPTRVVVRAEHSGWSFDSTNFVLTLSNEVYAAGAYRVPSAVVSNLVAAALRPWPVPASNAWPKFSIDPANLGLTEAWLQANYPLLLASYSGNPHEGAFPNLSEQQRAWLTDALTNLDLLADALRARMAMWWTCDYPSLELSLEHAGAQAGQERIRLKTTAQPAFMLPWEVQARGEQHLSGNADISRAVAQLLPFGFLHRDRLVGDLFEMVRNAFLNSGEVHGFLRKSILDETFGPQAGPTPLGFELRQIRVHGGSYSNYPTTFSASIHRTNWPERLTMPVERAIHRGVANGLPALLSRADKQLAPVLANDWIIARLASSSHVSIEVKEGSPVHPWLGAHMKEAGLGRFFEQTQPQLHRSLGFMLREGFDRASYWAILEDSRLLLYGFSGDGVLEWEPGQLGFQGDRRSLGSASIHLVGVFVGPDGRIAQKIAPEGDE